jgi:1-acyl-sn-glycerol-3-phosphate acyltransferase
MNEKLYNKIYSNVTIIIIIIFFLFLLFCLVFPLIHPWTLTIFEFIKLIPLPTFFINETILKWVQEGLRIYFNHEVVFDTKNIPESSIKCLMPHGIIPFNLLCLYNNEFFEKENNNIVSSHLLFTFPLLKDMLNFCNVIPAEYKLMKSKLENNKSIILFPGGVREVFSTDHRKEIICIKKRTGIFKMALETGKPLIPIYTFGLTSLHKRSGISLTLPMFFNNEKETIAFYYGRYYTIYPFRKKLLTVIGEPIEVNKLDNITDKDIEILRDRYIKSVKKLYKKWRCKYSKDWENRKIKFR